LVWASAKPAVTAMTEAATKLPAIHDWAADCALVVM
jgi:hypothetical protein